MSDLDETAPDSPTGDQSQRSTLQRYDAFLSYSHSADADFGRRLQLAIERFARPRQTPRTRRVFRDDTNLTASPNLWGEIERALTASRTFLLLASPAAATRPG